MTDRGVRCTKSLVPLLAVLVVGCEPEAPTGVTQDVPQLASPSKR